MKLLIALATLLFAVPGAVADCPEPPSPDSCAPKALGERCRDVINPCVNGPLLDCSESCVGNRICGDDDLCVPPENCSKKCPDRYAGQTCGAGPDNTGITFNDSCGRPVTKICPDRCNGDSSNCIDGICKPDCKPAKCPIGIPRGDPCGSILVPDPCTGSDISKYCTKCVEGSECKPSDPLKPLENLKCVKKCDSKDGSCPEPIYNGPCGILPVKNACDEVTLTPCNNCVQGQICKLAQGSDKGRCADKCEPKQCPVVEHIPLGALGSPCGHTDLSSRCSGELYVDCKCNKPLKCSGGTCVDPCTTDGAECPVKKGGQGATCGTNTCFIPTGCTVQVTGKTCYDVCKTGFTCVNNYCKKNARALRGSE